MPANTLRLNQCNFVALRSMLNKLYYFISASTDAKTGLYTLAICCSNIVSNAFKLEDNFSFVSVSSVV